MNPFASIEGGPVNTKNIVIWGAGGDVKGVAATLRRLGDWPNIKTRLCGEI